MASKIFWTSLAILGVVVYLYSSPKSTDEIHLNWAEISIDGIPLLQKYSLSQPLLSDSEYRVETDDDRIQLTLTESSYGTTTPTYLLYQKVDMQEFLPERITGKTVSMGSSSISIGDSADSLREKIPAARSYEDSLGVSYLIVAQDGCVIEFALSEDSSRVEAIRFEREFPVLVSQKSS